MTDLLVRAQSPAEFFKEHVEAACTRQRRHVSPPASFYVVNMLTAFARVPAGDIGAVSVDIRGKLVPVRVVKYPFVRDGKPGAGVESA